MKLLLLLILVTWCNIISSQTTNHDKLLSKEKISDTYLALKQGDLCYDNLEKCNSYLDVCEQAVKQLNLLVQLNAKDNINGLDKLNALNKSSLETQKHLDTANKKITDLESKKTKWYNNKWIYVALGFAGGVFIAK